MLRIKTLFIATAICFVSMFSAPQAAEAGPLLDWLRGLRRPANSCCATPSNAYAPQQAGYVPNAAGLLPGQCMKTCQQTCSRTVVNYVPYTAYRTNWTQVPVTQYKPVTSSDPCTGCTVTCMKPCTTYSYQMQRVPYTTYRPVYRNETYKVPVTTITNDCATGNCGTGCDTCSTGYNTAGYNPGCSTCGVNNISPLQQSPIMMQPEQSLIPNPAASGTYYEYPAANGTLSTGGGYEAQQPADAVPGLSGLNGVNPQTNYRPVLDRMRNTEQNYTTQQVTYPAYPTPAVNSYSAQTAQSPVRKEWNYSPIRLASYTSDVAPEPQIELPAARTSETDSFRYKSSFQPIQRPVDKNNDLNGWIEVK